ncbi:hypothetical protein P0L94_17390 [Microbacter sp. GSS18]|nr:hypothetical protein P0L94_17390 [Microbacter sp. GSS18]
MAMGRAKHAWLAFVNHTLNHVTRGLARWGHGPFSIIRHVGRRSGGTFEAPLILAPVPGGFVAELTYGPEVNWYRNTLHGGSVVLHRRREYRVVSVEPCTVEDGLAAFGPPTSVILRLLRRGEFRMLTTEPSPR